MIVVQSYEPDCKLHLHPQISHVRTHHGFSTNISQQKINKNKKKISKPKKIKKNKKLVLNFQQMGKLSLC